MQIDPLKSQDPHTIVGSRLICSSRSRLVVIAMAYNRCSAAAILITLSRNETGVVLLMLRKEQKEAGVLSGTIYRRTRSITT